MTYPVRALLSPLVAAVALALPACGGSVLASPGGDGGSMQTGDDDDVSPADGGTLPDGSTLPLDGSTIPYDGSELTPPLCPPSTPADGDTCYVEGLQCEYGTSPHIVCNEVVTCENGEWLLPPPTPGPPSAFCGPQSPLCPAGFDELPPATTCQTDPEIVCDYPPGTCGCEPSPLPNGVASWSCVGTPPGCPAVRPHLGAACDTQQMCGYAACIDGTGDFEECQGGYWQQLEEGCVGPGVSN